MKLAAIDIGSNAARLYIANVIECDGEVKFKKIHYMRYPLQLGKDVFQNGIISKAKYKEFLELIAVIKDVNKLYKVDNNYYACATSAMREASNSAEITERIFNKRKFKIDLISGKQEAQFISNALQNYIENDKNILHIDVGGGSTELNIYLKGIKINSESFDIGTVRDFKSENSLKENERMHFWIEENLKTTQIDYAIGTGGNIRKLQSINLLGSNEALQLKHLIEVKEKIEAMSFKDRLEKMLLNPDRAEVIVPAAEIFIKVMKQTKINKVEIPDIGLKDGIMLELYKQIMVK